MHIYIYIHISYNRASASFSLPLQMASPSSLSLYTGYETTHILGTGEEFSFARTMVAHRQDCPASMMSPIAHSHDYTQP